MFGLDEGALRYARLVWQHGPGVVCEYAERRLPPELFAEGPLAGPLREPAVLRALLADLLAGRSVRPLAASLVLPDRWLRLVLVEAADLPRAPAKRREALAWRLRRLVPFRVEDLRFAADDAALVPGRPRAAGPAPGSVLAAFALEPLLDQLEDAFAAAGITLGRICNESVAIAERLLETGPDTAPGAGLCHGLLLVRPEGYSLLIRRGAHPLLYRWKGGDGAAGGEAPSLPVERELRISLDYLREQEPGFALERLYLVAPQAHLEAWSRVVRQTLEVETRVIDGAALGINPGVSAPPEILAPLVGAALLEVA